MYFDVSQTRCDGSRSDERASCDSRALPNKKTEPILFVAPSNRNLGFSQPVRVLNHFHGFLVPRSHTRPPMANEFGEGFQMQLCHISTTMNFARHARERVKIMKSDINTIREDMAKEASED